jgi:hypothetical protein
MLEQVRRPKRSDLGEYGHLGGLINMAAFLGVIAWDEAMRLAELKTNAGDYAARDYRAAQEATHAA